MWCSPTLEDLGVPIFEAAYKECCIQSHPASDRKKWSHQVVYHSWSEMGAFNFSNKSEKESRKMYEHYYSYTLRQFMDGKDLKTISKAIENKNDDPWKTLNFYQGILPQYAHLNSREKAIPIITDILRKNNGRIHNGNRRNNLRYKLL